MMQPMVRRVPEGAIVVLCHGVWDVLHPGHVEHLRQARLLGQRTRIEGTTSLVFLVVSVTSDRYVTKGPNRPAFPAEDRAAILEALEGVDAVVINDAPSAVPVIEALRPDMYVKGPDYGAGLDGAGHLEEEKAALAVYGGRLVFTDGEVQSSTAIINRAMPRGPPEAVAFLQTIKDGIGLDGILTYLDRAKTLTAVVLGEDIVDEYIYVEPRWKSPKENTISYVRDGSGRWAGGARIIGQHLAAFTLEPRMALSGPIVKSRYVTKPFYQKVFSVVNQESVEPVDSDIDVRGFDCVLVCDFGHGAFTPRVRKARNGSQFLALMVQANSLNWGFNLLTNWLRADYVVADKMEWRLAAQDQHGPIEEAVARVARRLDASTAVATLGHEGCLVLDLKTGRSVRAPALADKVVDRMGAGDAFLAATAPLACVGAPIEVLALVGNIAGGIHVGVVGNSKALDTMEVRQWLVSLLK